MKEIGDFLLEGTVIPNSKNILNEEYAGFDFYSFSDITLHLLSGREFNKLKNWHSYIIQGKVYLDKKEKKLFLKVLSSTQSLKTDKVLRTPQDKYFYGVA